MSSDSIRSHLKSAPLLIFRHHVSFASPRDLERCFNDLETSHLNDDPNFYRASIGGVVKEDSQIYFMATLSAHKYRVYLLGKVEMNNEGGGCRISGYSGSELFGLVGIISVFGIVAAFLALQNPSNWQDILKFYIGLDVAIIIWEYLNTWLLASSLESVIRGILTE